MLGQVAEVKAVARIGGLTLEQDPRTATFVRKIIQRSVKQVLENQFPEVAAEITGETAFIEGITGAITVQVDSQLQFMFKFDIDRAAKEIHGFQVMEKVLPNHTLKLLAYDSDAGWFCVPFLALARNLHQIIEDSLLSDADILNVYADFLRQMLSLWISSYHATPPDQTRFINRLQNRSREVESQFASSVAGRAISFSRLIQMPMRVNGVDYPPIVNLLHQAIQLVRENPAPCSVTAHRDEHAKNILVETTNTSDKPHWYLIDLPNVSVEADWAWSIAKMRFWWLSYYYIDKVKHTPFSCNGFNEARVRFEVEQDKLLIEYELEDHIPSLCQVLDQRVQNLAEQMSEIVTDPGWFRRYTASLFAIFYGGITYHQNYQHVIPILLGEAVKALQQ